MYQEDCRTVYQVLPQTDTGTLEGEVNFIFSFPQLSLYIPHLSIYSTWGDRKYKKEHNTIDLSTNCSNLFLLPLLLMIMFKVFCIPPLDKWVLFLGIFTCETGEEQVLYICIRTLAEYLISPYAYIIFLWLLLLWDIILSVFLYH